MMRAPLGMVKLGKPEKVSGARVSGLMAGFPAEPFSGTAMVAAEMGRSEPPKAFEMTRRILGADCVRKIVWRSVAS